MLTSLFPRHREHHPASIGRIIPVGHGVTLPLLTKCFSISVNFCLRHSLLAISDSKRILDRVSPLGDTDILAAIVSRGQSVSRGQAP
jgi:hypothetical protein